MAEEKRNYVSKKKTRRQIARSEKRRRGPNGYGKDIAECWHKSTGEDIEDIEKYMYEFMAENKDYEINITIGTDSKKIGIGKVKCRVELLSTICFIRKRKGAHVILRRETHFFDRFVSTAEKLNMEVNKTYELAMLFERFSMEKPDVHLDLNPNQSFDSFNVYQHVNGWFESMGYNTEYKPHSAAAMSAADYYL